MSEITTQGGNGHDIAAADDYLSKLALNPDITAEKLKVMAEVAIQMQEYRRKVQREDRAEAAEVAYKAAMSRAQGRYPVVAKKGWQDHGRYAYIQFEDIWEQCCPIWTGEGLSVSFPATTTQAGDIDMQLHISHRDGHTHVVPSPYAPPDDTGTRGTTTKVAVQANQSTMTYLKKGLLLQGMGIATKDKDDDGAGGSPLRRSGPTPPPPDRPQTAKATPWLEGAIRTMRAGRAKGITYEMLCTNLGRLFGEVPTKADLDGFLDEIRADINDAPEWVQGRASDMLNAARKRLREAARPEVKQGPSPSEEGLPETAETEAEPGFEAVLIDANGVIGKTYAVRAEYAQALVDLACQTPASEWGTLLENNQGQMELAAADAEAAAILKKLDEPPPETPLPPLSFEPIKPKLVHGLPQWRIWTAEIRGEMAAVAEAHTPEDWLAWLKVQKDEIAASPKDQRALVLTTVDEVRKKLGLPFQAWAADLMLAR